MFVHRLSEPIDDFDGLAPLHERLDGDAERLAWALQAVLALAAAAQTVGWRGDMRHLPMVGHLPSSPFVTRYLVVKHDNNGDTFLVCETDPSLLFDQPGIETTANPIGAWTPPTRREMMLDAPDFGEPATEGADDEMSF